MKALEVFLPFVLPHVEGCGDPMALQAIRLSLIDFCQDTDLVQRIYTYDVVANQPAYTITVPAHMNMSRVLSLGWQGRWLGPLPPDAVPSDVVLLGRSVGQASPRTGDPEAFFQQTPSDTTFLLYPIPDTALAGGLTVKASYAPSQDAQTFEDHLFDNWCEEIACGAIARLMATPGHMFTNLSASASYRRQARGGITAAKRLKEQGYTQGAQRVAPRRFM